MKERKFFWIPGFLSADDLFLMGQDSDEVEKLLRITTEFGNEMDLTFNPAKNAIPSHLSKKLLRKRKRLEDTGENFTCES